MSRQTNETALAREVELLRAQLAASAERVKAAENAIEAFREIMAGGPYQDDDGCCSFCAFAPNDSEDLDNLIAHSEKCDWRKAKNALAALSSLRESKEAGHG